MDLSHITNQEAKFFLEIFLKDRDINREFYKMDHLDIPRSTSLKELWG